MMAIAFDEGEHQLRSLANAAEAESLNDFRFFSGAQFVGKPLGGPLFPQHVFQAIPAHASSPVSLI